VAGKSFAVKEIATGEFDEKCWLEFNLSQFEDEHELIGAFHQVRDRALSRVMPVVFWDEFDAREHHWLRYLLAPMQDGRFQEGQVTHPIGHAIFVFAGGVSPSYQLFGPLGDTEDDRNRWRASKGRDFKSRLDAFYDVTGPNPRPDDGKTPGSFDIGYPLRRALMMRGKLAHDLDDVLPIDGGLANALLLAPEYIHGARSIDKLVKPLAPAPKEPVRRSNLPPDEQIRMHTDLDSFRRHLEQEAGFMNSGAIEELAEAIHASWPNFKEQPGVNKSAYFNQEWEKLDEVAREDNRAAARRIPAVLALAGLALAGLGVSTDAAAEAPSLEELEKHLEHNLERLAEAEHDGWCDFRIRNGWRYDPERDDGEKRHPLLVPYDKLEEHVKDKDRDAVRNYPARVILADFRIVWLGEPQRAAATP